MTVKTFEEFKKFRNTELVKLAGNGAKGYHVFDNTVAEAIFKLKPTTTLQLSKIPGFPMNGERMKKYGQPIVNWFLQTSMFGAKKK